MPTQILEDAFVEVDSNDISSYVRSVTVNYEAESHDETAMGADTRKNKGGLKNWSMEFEFNQDFASSALDSILFPLVGTQVTVTVRPDSAAVGASNPQFSGTGLIQGYPIFGNSVGDLATAGVTIEPAGTLARTVA